MRHLLVALFSLLLGACATPTLVPPGTQESTPALFRDHARMEDGMELTVSRWLPEGEPRAAVLALHGFNDYRRAFDELGRRAAAAGIALYAVDQRGFGANAHPGLWAGSERLIADARQLAALVRTAHPHLPLYLLGESMGGAVAISAASRPGVADGLVLIAPAVWGRATMPPLQRLALWFMVRTFPDRVLTGEGLHITPSDNRRMLWEMYLDPLVIKGARVDALWGVTNLMDRALDDAATLHTPSLILYGEHDEIIPLRPTCRMLASLPPETPHRVVLYPQGYHMLTRDQQAEVVLDDILAWLLAPDRELPSAGTTGDPARLCAADAG